MPWSFSRVSFLDRFLFCQEHLLRGVRQEFDGKLSEPVSPCVGKGLSWARNPKLTLNILKISCVFIWVFSQLLICSWRLPWFDLFHFWAKAFCFLLLAFSSCKFVIKQDCTRLFLLPSSCSLLLFLVTIHFIEYKEKKPRVWLLPASKAKTFFQACKGTFPSKPESLSLSLFFSVCSATGVNQTKISPVGARGGWCLTWNHLAPGSTISTPIATVRAFNVCLCLHTG